MTLALLAYYTTTHEDGSGSSAVIHRKYKGRAQEAVGLHGHCPVSMSIGQGLLPEPGGFHARATPEGAGRERGDDQVLRE